MDFLKHRTAIERYVGSVSHPTRQISPDQNRRLHAIMPSCSEGIQGGLSITILIILTPLLYCIILYISLKLFIYKKSQQNFMAGICQRCAEVPAHRDQERLEEGSFGGDLPFWYNLSSGSWWWQLSIVSHKIRIPILRYPLPILTKWPAILFFAWCQ